jgi:hypothetical protein
MSETTPSHILNTFIMRSFSCPPLFYVLLRICTLSFWNYLASSFVFSYMFIVRVMVPFLETSNKETNCSWDFYLPRWSTSYLKYLNVLMNYLESSAFVYDNFVPIIGFDFAGKVEAVDLCSLISSFFWSELHVYSRVAFRSLSYSLYLTCFFSIIFYTFNAFSPVW